MNETMKTLLDHRCVRDFKTSPVEDALLDQVIEAGYRSPTSFNSQQVSVIVVRDAAKRATIAELAWGQPWIKQAPVFLVLVADMRKSATALLSVGETQKTHESLEGFASAAEDVGIALGRMATAAQSLGLGIVPIGAIRMNPAAMIELLKLPPLTFPMCGLVVGHPKDMSNVKPRLPLATFRHEETYNDAALTSETVKQYDATMLEHWKQVGRADGEKWTGRLASFYNRVYFPEVFSIAKKQGFSVDK